MKTKPKQKKYHHQKYPLIYIEWCDAYGNSAWFTEKEAIAWGEGDDWVNKQVGWLLKETKEYMVIASRWQNAQEQWGHLQKIPKTWIRERITL